MKKTLLISLIIILSFCPYNIAKENDNFSDWGKLKAIPSHFGPSSQLNKFINKIKYSDFEISSYNILNPKLDSMPKINIEFDYKKAGTHYNELVLRQVADTIIPFYHFSGHNISIEIDGEDLAKKSRNIIFLEISKASGLTKEESDRLEKLLAIIPVPTERNLKDNFTDFFKIIPERVVNILGQISRSAENNNIFLPSEGVSIGFPISKEKVLNLSFCVVEKLMLNEDLPKIGETSYWWNLYIGAKTDNTFTSDKYKITKNENIFYNWPRLTLSEVDKLLK